MMIGGAIIAVSEASTATAGYLVDNMVGCCFIFFIFILVLSIIEYVGMIKDRGLKSGILRFIAWNVGNVLLSIPLITFVYVSIIPQTNTSLVNMIISGVFFFFVILGMLSVYTKAMESIIDERYEDEDGIMVNLYVTAILGLVVEYFLNRFVVSQQ